MAGRLSGTAAPYGDGGVFVLPTRLPRLLPLNRTVQPLCAPWLCAWFLAISS